MKKIPAIISRWDFLFFVKVFFTTLKEKFILVRNFPL